MRTSHVLDCAAEVFTARGHRRPSDPPGPTPAYHRVTVAEAINLEPGATNHGDPAVAAVLAFLADRDTALATWSDTPRDGWRRLLDEWDDRPGRTQDEAVYVLRAAARAEREAGR